MFDMFPNEIIYFIQEQLEFIDKINLKTCNSFLYDTIKIIDLYNIDNYLLNKFNDEILLNYPYCVQLNAENNRNIKNVSHMTNLKKLVARQIVNL